MCAEEKGSRVWPFGPGDPPGSRGILPEPGWRVPGPCVRPASLPTCAVRTPAIAKPLPHSCFSPCRLPMDVPPASSWSRSRAFCWARCRKPGLQVPELLCLEWLLLSTHLLALSFTTTTCGHEASFEALPAQAVFYLLSAPSATQALRNTEERTNGSPSHLALNPEVGSGISLISPQTSSPPPEAPCSHQASGRVSAGISRAHSLVHCFSPNAPFSSQTGLS